MILVAKDSTDQRPIGYGCSSTDGYVAREGDSSFPKWDRVVGRGYKTWDAMEAAHPEINFDTVQRCGICGGPTPCLRND